MHMHFTDEVVFFFLSQFRHRCINNVYASDSLRLKHFFFSLSGTCVQYIYIAIQVRIERYGGKNTNILSHFKVLPTCVGEIMFMLTGFCLEKSIIFRPT